MENYDRKRVNENEIGDFEAFIQNSLGCFAIYKAIRNGEGSIVDFLTEHINDVGCESLHISREELEGRRLLELLPVQTGERIFDKYCYVVKTGKPFYIEDIKHDIFSNKKLNIVVDIIVVKYKDGCAVTWWNKTENDKLKKTLNESEEFFKGAFENAAIGMALTGIDGKHLRVNHSFCEMTGYTKKELLKTTFMDITYKDDLKRSLNYFKQAIEGKIKYYHLKKRYIHKNGNIIWVNLSTSVVRDAKGKPLYFTTQIQDITKIKQANEAIEYDKLKTEFFANLSHELRTPLNVILASIQLSESHIRKGSEINIENVNKFVRIIKQNCLRLLRLVNNLIDITKIDAGFYELKLRPTDIINLIEAITFSVAEYAKGKGIIVQFFTDVKEKVISIDPDKIERIMLNLLSNAIKFTKSNGNINVSVHDNGNSINISVKDSGIGIPLDKQEIIFQRFRQVEQTLAKSHEGSGIGLSLVKSFVELHGGKIQLISEIGKGSEFILKLPVKEVSDYDNNEIFYNSATDCVERINIEFSDIYNLK